MITHTDFINSIPEAKPIKIYLPLQGEDSRYRAQCIFHKTEAPRFNLLFEPDSLPINSLDLKTPSIITFDINGKAVSLEAMIVNVVGEQVLEMIARRTFTHEQMREFFRVDFTMPILIKSRFIEGFDAPEKQWSLSGSTMDLSGNGILVLFHEKPPADKIIRGQLPLSDTTGDIVNFLARPVRVTKVEKDRYVVAYHFEEISDEDRDRIVGQCLKIQRRMLRLKIQVKDL